MRCEYCGTENVDGAHFCKGCGGDLTQQNGAAGQSNRSDHSNENWNATARQNSSNINPPQVGDMGDYQPISMWGYFGYELLFAIPCVGFIMLLVFSFGGTKNVNLRNFARSYFCFYIVVIVLMLFLFFSTGMASMMGRMYY